MNGIRRVPKSSPRGWGPPDYDINSELFKLIQSCLLFKASFKSGYDFHPTPIPASNEERVTAHSNTLLKIFTLFPSHFSLVFECDHFNSSQTLWFSLEPLKSLMFLECRSKNS